MTNPGHVDPGYRGTLKFTLINMGKNPFPLIRGQLICTLLFFRVEAPEVPYNELDTAGKRPPPPPDDPDRDLRSTLAMLSKDFLEFDSRIKQEVDSTVSKAQVRTPIISAIISGSLAVLLTLGLTLGVGYLNDVWSMRVKLEGLEKSIGVNDVKARLEKLETVPVQQTLLDIKTRIEKLEGQQVQSPKP